MKLSGGGYSLYLEMNRDGTRSFEFLHLYLRPEQTREDKRTNRATWEAARTIQAERTVDIQKGRASMLVPASKTPLLSEYCKSFLDSRRLARSTALAYLRSVAHFTHANGDLHIGEINKQHIVRFVTSITAVIQESSADMNLSKINALLRRAAMDGHIASNPCEKLDASQKPKKRGTQREYLTIDELRLLAGTPCRNESIKRAFMFACFTGLRISDIIALRWDMMTRDGIRIRMQKTGELVYIPLTDNARAWLPPGKTDPVFQLGVHPNYLGPFLKEWTEAAGITKRVTFHVSRHTFATLLISSGADIYVVSKLLGHTNVATTQIYARIIDEARVRAVNLIPQL